MVLLDVLPMISSSTFSGPDATIFVLSVLLPTMSTTTDPGLPNASAPDADSISAKANMIDNFNFIPPSSNLIINQCFIYTKSRKVFRPK